MQDHDRNQDPLSRKNYEDALLRVSELIGEIAELKATLNAKIDEVTRTFKPIQQDLLAIVTEKVREEKEEKTAADQDTASSGRVLNSR